jgi:hypothetical protein
VNISISQFIVIYWFLHRVNRSSAQNLYSFLRVGIVIHANFEKFGEGKVLICIFVLY